MVVADPLGRLERRFLNHRFFEKLQVVFLIQRVSKYSLSVLDLYLRKTVLNIGQKFPTYFNYWLLLRFTLTQGVNLGVFKVFVVFF